MPQNRPPASNSESTTDLPVAQPAGTDGDGSRGFEQADRLVGVDLTVLDPAPVLRPELRDAFEACWNHSEAAYRYLADDEM